MNPPLSLPSERRTRRGNTLVELMIYMALSVIILLGLTNVMTRLRQAELSSAAKTDVQQTLRNTFQQLSGLAQLYQYALFLNANGLPTFCPDDEDVHTLLFWNLADNPDFLYEFYSGIGPLHQFHRDLQGGNPESVGSCNDYYDDVPPIDRLPRNHIRVSLEQAENGRGWISVQEVIGGIEQDRIPLTPESVTIENFKVEDHTGLSPIFIVGFSVRARERSRAQAANSQAEWSMTHVVYLNYRGNSALSLCCPTYLHFCPHGLFTCENSGCFESMQPADDALGQVALQTGFANFSSSWVQSGIRIQEGLPIQDEVQPFHTNGWGLHSPAAVALDRINHFLYVADTANNRVLRFRLHEKNAVLHYYAQNVFGQLDGDGQPSPTQNTEGEGTTGMKAPSGVAYDEARHLLFVADTGNDRIMVFDLSDASEATEQYHHANHLLENVGEPRALALDATNKRLFIAHDTGIRIVRYDNDESYWDESEDDIAMSDAVLALEYYDELLFAGHESGVDAFDVPADGNASLSGTEIDTEHETRGIAYDAAFNRLFLSQGNRVREFTFDSDASLPSYIPENGSFGEESTGAGPQLMNGPQGLAFDPSSQHLFVTDTGNHRILQFRGGACEADKFIPPSPDDGDPGSQDPGGQLFNVNLTCTSPTCDPLNPGDSSCTLHGAVAHTDDLSQNPNWEAIQNSYIELCAIEGSTLVFGFTASNDYLPPSSVNVHMRYRLNHGVTPGGDAELAINPTGFLLTLERPGVADMTRTYSIQSDMPDGPWTYGVFELEPLSGASWVAESDITTPLALRIQPIGNSPMVQIALTQIEIQKDGTHWVYVPDEDVTILEGWSRYPPPPSDPDPE